MVVATMHGEENFGQYVARGLLEGAEIEDVDLWVVPVLNPDGLANDRRWLSKHVDLNRNFPTRWKKRANSGTKAKSAVETRVIMRFLNKIDPKYLVSWHQPLHGVDSDSVKNKGLMRRLAKNLDLPKKPLVCGGACHGTMTMWFNRHHAGAAITVEYGSKARTMARMKGRDADAVLAAIGGKRAVPPTDALIVSRVQSSPWTVPFDENSGHEVRWNPIPDAAWPQPVRRGCRRNPAD